MATYHSNVAAHVRPADEVAAEITIRTIDLSSLMRALRLGWDDFKAVPSHAVMLCAIYPVLGLVLADQLLLAGTEVDLGGVVVGEVVHGRLLRKGSVLLHRDGRTLGSTPASD